MSDEPQQHQLFRQLENPFPIGTAASSRYDEMRAAAIAFHAAHPNVWRLFCRFTFNRIERGFRHYSVNAVFERIRWETDEARVDVEAEFKLNNNHRAFYARAFMRSFPQHDGFFRTRRQTSHGDGAVGMPELGPSDFQ